MTRRHPRSGLAVALLGCVLAVAAGAGCLCGPKTGGVVAEGGRLMVEEPSFAKNVSLMVHAPVRTEDGFLHAQATIKNRNRTDFRCQYQFVWFDEAGMAMKHARTPWRPLVLHGRETKELDAVAPFAGAHDFRLEVRPAD